MKMKVRMDNTIRTVSSFTVRFELFLSFTMLTRLAPRLSTISPSNTTMMIFTMSMDLPFPINRASLPEPRWLSI